MAYATSSQRTSGEWKAEVHEVSSKPGRPTWDHVSSQTGMDARHEATHAVVGRLLSLCFRESTIDRSRVCGLTKAIYRKTSFLPPSIFSLFWDLYPGVTDIEFPVLGPTVMVDPDRRRYLDDWLTTVLAGYESERQMGFHGGDLDLAKARRVAAACFGGDAEVGKAYVEKLSRRARTMLNESLVSQAIDQVAAALLDRETLTMAEVDRILEAVSAPLTC